MSVDPALDATLKFLGAQLASGEIQRVHYQRRLSAELQRWLGCSRVGVWQIFGQSGQRVMRCLARHDEHAGPHAGGEEIHEHEYRDYFGRLVQQGVYVANETLDDPLLAPMRDTYLVPHDVRSIMDAAFTLNGKTFGVVCCEQLGRPRTWTTAEMIQLKRCASLVTLHAARVDRDAAWWEGPLETA
jgi:GAF domain-containing protein